MLCGDFNGRIADECDFIHGVDAVTRSALDTGRNGHGDCLLKFVKDCKFCLLNGGVTPEHDNYTCASNPGKSVLYCGST